MIRISELAVRDLCFEIVSDDVQIMKGYYYKSEFLNESVIFWSQIDQSNNINSDVVAVGIPIIKIGKKKQLLPGIINLMILPEIDISDQNDIQKVSRGQTLILHKPDGVYHLVDQHKRKIAILRINKGNIVNHIDIGYYLRQGN